MSASVFYYKLNDKLTPEQLHQLIDAWFNDIPTEKKIKIKKLRKLKDQALSLAGLRLIETGIKEIMDLNFSLTQINFPHNKKPFVDGNIDFNISHSGNIVCCVISNDFSVGIDVERQREVTPLTMSKFLNENNHGHSQINKQQRFFNLWTIYEAIIKAANHGSIFNINEITIEEKKGHYQNKDWYFYPVDIMDREEPNTLYTCHIACSEETSDIKVKNILEL